MSLYRQEGWIRTQARRVLVAGNLHQEQRGLLGAREGLVRTLMCVNHRDGHVSSWSSWK